MRALSSKTVFAKMTSYKGSVKQELDMVFLMSIFEKLRTLWISFLTTLKNVFTYLGMTYVTIYGVNQLYLPISNNFLHR